MQVEKHENGRFCWAELSTSDGPGAKSFYTSLFGWEAIDNPMGPNMVPVPYPIITDLSNSVEVAKSVRFNGDGVFLLSDSVDPAHSSPSLWPSPDRIAMVTNVSAASIHSRFQASHSGATSKPSQVKPSRTKAVSSLFALPAAGSITT